MEFVAKTFKYLKSSWWLIWLMCLPVSIMLGFLVRPMALVSFLPSYALTDINNFSGMVALHFESLLIGNDTPLWAYFIIFIAVLVVLFLTVCVCYSLIEEHFRTDKLRLKKPLSRINEYFIPAVRVFALAVVFFVIYFALIVGLNALQHSIFSSRVRASVGSIIVMGFLAFSIFILVSWFSAPFVMMLPLMQVYGYEFGDALRNSASNYGKKPFKISFGLAFVFFILIILASVLAGIEAFIPSFVRIILSILLQSFALVYFFAYSMVVSFDVGDITRRDKGALENPW